MFTFEFIKIKLDLRNQFSSSPATFQVLSVTCSPWLLHWTVQKLPLDRVSLSRECGEHSLGSCGLLIPSPPQAHMPTHAYRALASPTTSWETCTHSHCSTKRRFSDSVCSRPDLVASGQLLPPSPPARGVLEVGVAGAWRKPPKDVTGPEADSPSVMVGGSPVPVYYRLRDNQHEGTLHDGHTLGHNLCI